MDTGENSEQQAEEIDHILKGEGTWFNIWRWTIVLMYTEYVHDVPEESYLNLGKIKDIYAMGDN